MKKFKVCLMTAYCIWEGVEAETKEDAIAQCHFPPEVDLNDEFSWEAVEQEEEGK